MRARIPSRLVTGLTAAVAALAIGGLTAAPAQAADDWYQVGNWTIGAHSRDSGWALTYPESPSGPSQAEGRGQVHWSNGNETKGYATEIRTAANDSVRDTWCALTEVFYQKKVNGSWTNQYRVNSQDCADEDGKAHWGTIQHARTPIRHVRFRVCLGVNWQADHRLCGDWSWA